jgi:hypothetical protein
VQAKPTVWQLLANASADQNLGDHCPKAAVSGCRRRIRTYGEVLRSGDTAQHTQSNGDADDPPAAMLSGMAARKIDEAGC